MSSKDTELEVKFYLSSLPALKARLEVLGAGLTSPRVLEINLRFDTPGGELTREMRVLRLRQDSQVRMTYKGPGSLEGGARLRQELEFKVSSFETAKALLEALGFQVVVMYEKYRTTYQLGAVEVTLDEMPYGYFAEVEGPDGESIQEAARRLGLDWETRILDSYIVLFDRVRESMGLPFRDLSFENFQGLQVPLEALGVKAGD
jgi:adenylate cyclase class 2